MKTKPDWRLHTLSWIKMDRKFNIDQLFTYTMGNTNGSTWATTSVDSTIGYQHTAVKEEAREGGRYNRDVRGYFNVRLPGGKRCLGRSLCFCNGFTIRFNRITYYCKQVGHDYFASHLETLIQHRWNVCSCCPLLVWCLLLLLQWWIPRLAACCNYSFHAY